MELCEVMGRIKNRTLNPPTLGSCEFDSRLRHQTKNGAAEYGCPFVFWRTPGEVISQGEDVVGWDLMASRFFLAMS